MLMSEIVAWEKSTSFIGNREQRERRKMSAERKTPWERAKVGRRARKSEEQGAKISGGRRVSGSGNRREKGDIRTNGFRIEDKFTDASSYTIQKSELEKITHEALMTPPGLLPQMRITMPGFKLRVLREQDYLYLEALAAENVDANL